MSATPSYPDALASIRAGYTMVRTALDDPRHIAVLDALENVTETTMLASETAFGYVIDVQDAVTAFVRDVTGDAVEPQSRRALRVIRGGAA